MLKQIRIGQDGRIVAPDRDTHVTTSTAADGPDQVQWIRVSGNSGTYKIRFARSPFQAGAQTITVPPSNPHTVTQAPDTYKYDVLDSSDTVIDDPNVIIQ